MVTSMTDWLLHQFVRYRLRFAVYTLLGISVFALSWSAVGKEEKIDYVVAVVNEQAITWTELRSALVIGAFVDPLVSLSPPLIDELRNPSDEAQRAILDIFIDRTLMLQEAERWGIPLAHWHDKVTAAMKSLKMSYPAEIAFYETLRLSGLEYAELEEWMRAGLIIDDLIFRKFIKGIDREKIEQESLQYYDQHKSEYSETAKVRFNYVLVPLRSGASLEEKTQAERSAKEIYLYLRNGMPINEFQQSEHGSVQLETENLDSKLGSKIAALKTKKWHPPIRTPNGYLVVNSLGVEEPRQKTYAEAKDEIKRVLIDKEVGEQMEKWLLDQKKIGNWRILAPSLARINGRNPCDKP